MHVRIPMHASACIRRYHSYNSEGSVSHINGVWPILSNEQLIHSTKNLTLRVKQNPPTSAFFLAEHVFTASFQAVMSDLEKLIKDLSNKVDGFQKDLKIARESGRSIKSVGPGVTTVHPCSHDLMAVRTQGTSLTLGESIKLVVDPRHHLGERHVVIRIGARRAPHTHMATRKGAQRALNVLWRIPHQLLDVTEMKSWTHRLMTRSLSGVTILQWVATRSLRPTLPLCCKRWSLSSRTPALPDWNMLVV